MQCEALTRHDVDRDTHVTSLSEDGMFELIRTLLGKPELRRDRVDLCRERGDLVLFAVSASGVVAGSGKRRDHMAAMMTKFVGISLEDALAAARMGTLHARVERAIRALLQSGRDAVVAALVDVVPSFDAMAFVATYARLKPDVELTDAQEQALVDAHIDSDQANGATWNSILSQMNAP